MHLADHSGLLYQSSWWQILQKTRSSPGLREEQHSFETIRLVVSGQMHLSLQCSKFLTYYMPWNQLMFRLIYHNLKDLVDQKSKTKKCTVWNNSSLPVYQQLCSTSIAANMHWHNEMHVLGSTMGSTSAASDNNSRIQRPPLSYSICHDFMLFCIPVFYPGYQMDAL